MLIKTQMIRFALFVMFIVSVNAYAGVCNNRSLLNGYTYELSGVDTVGSVVSSYHAVGNIYFNGAGSVSFSGYETTGGSAVTDTGSGTYIVTPGCFATGTITWNSGVITHYALYLDQMDSMLATRLAYHGALTTWSSNGLSLSGSINKVSGKFQ